MTKMIRLAAVSVIACGALLAGCSADSTQRGAFEALQSMSQADCQKSPTAACPLRSSYDDYQSQRRNLGAN